MNTDQNRVLLHRAVPFAMAMLLLALTGLPASAIFGREKAAVPAADAGAPIAQSMELRVYRGIPYTGTLTAIDRKDGEVSFAIAEEPAKGTVTLDGDTFVYTSEGNKTGADSFTYTTEYYRRDGFQPIYTWEGEGGSITPVYWVSPYFSRSHSSADRLEPGTDEDVSISYRYDPGYTTYKKYEPVNKPAGGAAE